MHIGHIRVEVSTTRRYQVKHDNLVKDHIVITTKFDNEWSVISEDDLDYFATYNKDKDTIHLLGGVFFYPLKYQNRMKTEVYIYLTLFFFGYTQIQKMRQND